MLPGKSRRIVWRANSIQARAMGCSQLVLEDDYEPPFVPSPGLREDLNR